MRDCVPDDGIHLRRCQGRGERTPKQMAGAPVHRMRFGAYALP